MVGCGPDSHEILRCFDENNWTLNETLQKMLNEHFSHRTERRGAGYTQATRYLAVFVNEPRREDEYDEVRMFIDRGTDRLRTILETQERLGLKKSWRSLDLKPIPSEISQDASAFEVFKLERARQAQLRALPGLMDREESKLIASLVSDLVLPIEDHHTSPVLSPYPEKLQIGTCPLAEKYFLEVADAFVRRKGRVNIITSDDMKPLLLEKVGLGDDHSSISLAPLLLNGVRLPAGSLLGTRYEGSVSERANKNIPGDIIPISRCEGFRFLRLTTLAVSPANRERAFTAHYKTQIEAGLFSPQAATIEQLRDLALKEM